jgi:hypothetical protein
VIAGDGRSVAAVDAVGTGPAELDPDGGELSAWTGETPADGEAGAVVTADRECDGDCVQLARPSITIDPAMSGRTRKPRQSA